MQTFSVVQEAKQRNSIFLQSSTLLAGVRVQPFRDYKLTMDWHMDPRPGGVLFFSNQARENKTRPGDTGRCFAALPPDRLQPAGTVSQPGSGPSPRGLQDLRPEGIFKYKSSSKKTQMAGVTGCTKLLYTPYISRGFYFREFRESGASREFNNTRKYLPPIRTHECDLCTPPRSRI